MSQHTEEQPQAGTSPVEQLQTLGDLRSFLARAIVDVQRGDISDSQARNISKLAMALNESIYAEIRMQASAVMLGHAAIEVGAGRIGGPATPLLGGLDKG